MKYDTRNKEYALCFNEFLKMSRLILQDEHHRTLQNYEDKVDFVLLNKKAYF